MRACTLTLLVLPTLTACGTSDTCRDPEFTAYELSDYTSCSVRWDLCESENSYWIDCDNDTFSGDYECECWATSMSLGEALWPLSDNPTFESPDACDLDAEAAIDEMTEACGWDIEEVE